MSNAPSVHDAEVNYLGRPTAHRNGIVRKVHRCAGLSKTEVTELANYASVVRRHPERRPEEMIHIGRDSCEARVQAVSDCACNEMPVPLGLTDSVGNNSTASNRHPPTKTNATTNPLKLMSRFMWNSECQRHLVRVRVQRGR